MLPLRDDNPTRNRAYVTLGLIALNVFAFLFWEPTFASGPNAELAKTQFFYCHALVPYEVVHHISLAHAANPTAQSITEQLRLATACPNKSWLLSVFVSMFLHGGWLHIGGNMLFLWVFGNNVEDKLGGPLYLLFYLAAGIAATITQIAVVHGGQNDFIPNLGASGAIAGVLGAYLVMFPRRRVLTLIIFFIITAIYLPAFVVLGLWFVLQFFNGVAALSNRVNVGGGVAVWAHIGGFAFGALIALLFLPKERFGQRPPPPRPDVWGRRRGWGWGRGTRPGRPDGGLPWS
jgi:membrane associated rhomboid family serine protease